MGVELELVSCDEAANTFLEQKSHNMGTLRRDSPALKPSHKYRSRLLNNLENEKDVGSHEICDRLILQLEGECRWLITSAKHPKNKCNNASSSKTVNVSLAAGH